MTLSAVSMNCVAFMLTTVFNMRVVDKKHYFGNEKSCVNGEQYFKIHSQVCLFFPVTWQTNGRQSVCVVFFLWVFRLIGFQIPGEDSEDFTTVGLLVCVISLGVSICWGA